MLLQIPSGNPPLEFTQGDNIAITLIATDDLGNPQVLTGASLSSQILGVNNVGPVVFGNSQHTLANQTSNPGQFTLTLANTDTPNCAVGANKQIITAATIAGVVTNYRGNNILTVYPPAPEQ